VGAFAPLSRGWSARPLGRLKARLAAAIEHLRPTDPAVFLFRSCCFSLKLLGLWMLAHGSWLGAMAVLALAKVVSMGVDGLHLRADAAESCLQLNWFAGSTSTCWSGWRKRTR
jgi:hypothetical protein